MNTIHTLSAAIRRAAKTIHIVTAPARIARSIFHGDSSPSRIAGACMHRVKICPRTAGICGHGVSVYSRIAAGTILYVTTLSLAAQETQWQKFNRILDRFDTFELDTAYAARPATRWTLSVQTKIVKSVVTMTGRDKAGTKYEYEMESDDAETFSLCATYRCISASISINPAHQSDLEVDLDFYGDAFGWEVLYHKAQSFSWKDEDDDDAETIVPPGARQQYLMANAYYVLRHKRFSYPAAFYNLTLQRQSCGSVIFGLNYYGNTLDFADLGEGSVGERGIRRIRTRYGGLSAGYAHNWVPHRQWVLHLSAMPTLICWRKNTIDYGTEGRERIPRRPLDVFVLTRFAATYSWSRYFVGANVVYTLSALGREQDLKLKDEAVKAKMFVGVRF